MLKLYKQPRVLVMEVEMKIITTIRIALLAVSVLCICFGVLSVYFPPTSQEVYFVNEPRTEKFTNILLNDEWPSEWGPYYYDYYASLDLYEGWNLTIDITCDYPGGGYNLTVIKRSNPSGWDTQFDTHYTKSASTFWIVPITATYLFEIKAFYGQQGPFAGDTPKPTSGTISVTRVWYDQITVRIGKTRIITDYITGRNYGICLFVASFFMFLFALFLPEIVIHLHDLRK
jgi:hypothetical protein